MSLATDNVLKLMKSLGPTARARPSFGRHLASALEWTKDESRIEPVRNLDFPGEVNYGLIGHQPATIFAGHKRSEGGELLRIIASFAYHSSIEWGVITNSVETIVFNSHWVKNRDWFSLPPLHRRELSNNIGLISALTPAGLTHGSIEREAHRFYEPDTVLLPVDDQLVDTLDTWRDETLRHSTRIDNVDKNIQTLFAQLFVLRAVEDRNLDRSIPPLQSALEKGGSVDLNTLEGIFTMAKKNIQSELFNISLPRGIPPFVLNGIIRDLYGPRGFPIENVRYNFAWISASVLGRAYEKYLSTVLIPSPQIDRQLRLWDQPKREVERISRRKASGVYYTPEFIVRYLTDKCLGEYFRGMKRDDIKIPSIADISCGSGSFLTRAVDALIRILKSFDGANNWGKALVRRGAIVGIDVDQRAVTLTRLALWLRFTEEPDPLPLPSLEKIIVCGDSLRRDVWKELPNSFDIVLGNPPFLPTTQVPTRMELIDRFKTATGRFDYSYLFVELAIQKLKTGGFLGLVVPNRLFGNKNAATIRGLLTKETDLLTVVDFGATKVFTGTSSYVGLICAKKGRSEPKKDKIRYLCIGELPPRFAGAVLLSADRTPDEIKDGSLTAYLARHPRGSRAWVFLSELDLKTRILLESQPELGTIANVFQGIKTGANDIFVVELETSADGSICRVVNGLGETHLLERGCLRPVVYGSEIRRYDSICPMRFLIYPYESGRAIPEQELERRFPRTYQYLKQYRDILFERASRRGEWYELARKREERWLEAKKLLIRDLAIEPSFALDEDGTVFLIGGTAVVPQDDSHLEPLLGYLNSRVSQWYLRPITPSFNRGFQKFQPHHILQLPVPRVVFSDGHVKDRLTKLVRFALNARQRNDEKRLGDIEEKINKLLFKAAKIRLDEVP